MFQESLLASVVYLVRNKPKILYESNAQTRPELDLTRPENPGLFTPVLSIVYC